eukprot:TRINITY_DN1555_c0_g1_i18.p1 TRINITY_DN1555_c0_g1~~TRINITY_DN1555_c0_g1_i18.p1  ORF type:complete len:108 (-),score=23.54 TRINITY_DN1555_c0_g1_i18:46-369(-)
MGQAVVSTQSTGGKRGLGIVSGALEVAICQPILYWKNASQQKLKWTINPRFLYRGLAMSVTNMAVLTGLQFPLTGVVTSLVTGGTARRLSPSEMISLVLLAHQWNWS